jgi:hypothetical protein
MSDTDSLDESEGRTPSPSIDYQPAIAAKPPKVLLQEESQFEVSSSPAFQCLDDVSTMHPYFEPTKDKLIPHLSSISECGISPYIFKLKLVEIRNFLSFENPVVLLLTLYCVITMIIHTISSWF